MFSNDKHYLMYTEGYQDTGETEVILHDLQSGESRIITTGDKEFGAIAQFNKAGDKVVYAFWTPDQQHPDIAVYDIATGLNEQLGLNSTECWRPVFWQNDTEILYIHQNENSGYFEVNSYSLESKETRNIIARPYDIWDIAVSPTEKFIAYAGKTEGNWNIFIHELETGSDYQLTYGSGDEWDPSFGGTDRELWFAGTAGINNGIYYLTINDSFTNNHN
jgi:Tol biopolymer transport system component